jgi:phosphocarrier protein FPr
MDILPADQVVLGARAADRFDAVRQAGEVLVRAGCVPQAYISGMLAREHIQSTYLGAGIAIPHGERADLMLVIRAGISVLQLPDGVDWEPGERAHLVVGLAFSDLQAAGVLSNLLALLQTPGAVHPLIHTTDPRVIIDSLTRGRSENRWN